MELDQPLSSRPKSDIAFFRAFQSLASIFKLAISCEVSKIIGLTTIFVIAMANTPTPDSNYIICLSLDIAASAFGILMAAASLSCFFNSPIIYLNIAEQCHYTVAGQNIRQCNNISDCVSATVFVAEIGLTQGEITEDLKKVHVDMAKTAIDSVLRTRYAWFRNGLNFKSLIAFAAMINTIILLASESLSSSQQTILSLFVVFIGLTELKMVLGCVLLCLAPLICVGLMIYCCCCSSKNSGTFIAVSAKPATTGDIVNAGGDCAICYQSMAQGDRIYVLTCSEKHVFHGDCLEHWAKVKNTCPICRTEIPMADNKPDDALA